MTLGTGLFLSALILSLVILYSVTRDRWNWRRLVFWVCLGMECWISKKGGADEFLD